MLTLRAAHKSLRRSVVVALRDKCGALGTRAPATAGLVSRPICLAWKATPEGEKRAGRAPQPRRRDRETSSLGTRRRRRDVPAARVRQTALGSQVRSAAPQEVVPLVQFKSAASRFIRTWRFAFVDGTMQPRAVENGRLACTVQRQTTATLCVSTRETKRKTQDG